MVDDIETVRDNDGAAELPVSDAVLVPEDWRDLHWKQRVSLAKQVSGHDVENVTDADAILKAAAEPPPVDMEGLVRMEKSGEELHVHPTAVDAHAKLGWRVA